MRGISGLLVVVGTVAACHADALSDPADLDGDGIKDDPCIAAPADDTYDYNGNGIANAADPCPGPFGYSEADGDGDGIPDPCDPFPLPGDRHRCTMEFSDPALDAALWTARAGHSGWTYQIGSRGPLLAGGSGASAVASESLEAPTTTTYEATINGSASFTFLVRADSTPSDTDVGCTLNAVPNGLPDFGGDYQLAIVQGSTILSTATGASHLGSVTATLFVVVEPGAAGPTVRCSVIGNVFYSSEELSEFALGPVTAAVTLPPGNVGFSTDGGTNIELLSIYDRDDSPSL